MRIYILSGWLGRLLSGGMSTLIPYLSPYGETTFHSWNDTVRIVREANAYKGPVVLIGYSEGATMLGWIEIAKVLKRQIELGVAYDPRNLPRIGPVCTVHKYDRMLCFHNSSPWPIEAMKYAGKGVEVEEINVPHPMVQLDWSLHNKTIAAVKKLSVTLQVTKSKPALKTSSSPAGAA